MLDEMKNHKHIQFKELISMFLSALVIGFVMSFRSWGTDAIDIVMGITTFIVLTLSAFVFIIIRTWTQKFVALKKGYLTTYTFHKYTLPISVVLTFFTNGIIPYVSPGDLKIKESKRLRLGSFRYGLNYSDLAIIGIAAPVSMILLMILIKPLFLITNNTLINKIIWTAAAITFFGMIPIKGQEGLDIFFYRRWLFVITITFVIIYFLLILISGVFSYVIAAIIALGVAWIYKEFIN